MEGCSRWGLCLRKFANKTTGKRGCMWPQLDTPYIDSTPKAMRPPHAKCRTFTINYG